jgi:hypothetical protein
VPSEQATAHLPALLRALWSELEPSGRPILLAPHPYAQNGSSSSGLHSEALLSRAFHRAPSAPAPKLSADPERHQIESKNKCPIVAPYRRIMQSLKEQILKTTCGGGGGGHRTHGIILRRPHAGRENSRTPAPPIHSGTVDHVRTTVTRAGLRLVL